MKEAQHPKLTRAQRRRMRKLQAFIERITQGDLRFFAKFPQRKYRVREADIAEIAHDELLGFSLTLSPSNRHCRAVRYLTPYACVSLPVGGMADIDPQLLDEETSRAIFKHAGSGSEGPPRVFIQGEHTHAEITVLLEVLK
jgi:hypothetical protein